MRSNEKMSETQNENQYFIEKVFQFCEKSATPAYVCVTTSFKRLNRGNTSETFIPIFLFVYAEISLAYISCMCVYACVRVSRIVNLLCANMKA